MIRNHTPLFLGMALALAACGDSAENNADNSQPNNTSTNNTSANNTATNNTATNNATTNNTATNNTPTNAVSPPSFADDVVPIFQGAGCAAAGCHLDPGNQTSFVVGAAADAAAFEAALDGVMTGGGRALVVGGDLDNSELYLRVTGTGVARMPFGGTLDPDEIDTVTAWIDGGAAFD